MGNNGILRVCCRSCFWLFNQTRILFDFRPKSHAGKSSFFFCLVCVKRLKYPPHHKFNKDVNTLLQSIGFIGPGFALLCLNYAKTPVIASVFITVALSLSSFSQAGFLLNMQVRLILFFLKAKKKKINKLWTLNCFLFFRSFSRILHLNMRDFSMVCVFNIFKSFIILYLEIIYYYYYYFNICL